MGMRKVAIIGPELVPIPPIRGGAAELWIEKVAHNLTRYRPFVFSIADPELTARETTGGVQYFRIPVSRAKRTFYSWFKAYLPDYEKRMIPMLREIDPDILHIHNRPLLIPFFRQHFPGKKIILHMHNLYQYLGRLERPESPFRIAADLFIGCSRFIVESEKERLAQGSLCHAVLYNGVDTEEFSPSSKHRDAGAIRRRYGLENKQVVLYTGKIRNSKGVGLLVTAMKEVFRHNEQAILVLVGGTGFGYKRTEKRTEFMDWLQKEIAPCRDRVLMLGFFPPQEMPQVYLLGDVFAAPSQLQEGFGMVFLEASASGLPIVSTRGGGIPEAVIHEETGLLLLEKDNAEELAEKIMCLLRKPAYGRALGYNGRKRMLEYFSWPNIGRLAEELYDSLGNNGPMPSPSL